jgi:hypothetical protein
MQLFIDILTAILSWGVVCFVAVPVVQRRDRDVRVGTSWYFLLCFALAVTFEIDPFYLWLDQITRVSNIAWFFSGVCIVIGIYFIVITSHATEVQAPIRTWRFITLAVLLVSSILFWSELWHLPSWLEHLTPRTLNELLYMLVIYTYTAGMGMLTARSLSRIASKETLEFGLRTLVLCCGCCVGVFFFTSKCLYALLTWMDSNSHITQFLFLQPLSMSLLGILIVCGFLPQRLYRKSAHEVERIQQFIALREYFWLEHQIEPLYKPLLKETPTVWECWKTPLYYQYRVSIYVLDSHKTLKAHVSPEARRLYQGMESVGILNTHYDCQELLKRCRQLSYYLRTKSRNE